MKTKNFLKCKKAQLLFLTLTVLVVTSVSAQKNEISVNRSKEDGSPQSFQFKDRAGKVAKTIDLESVNPYKGGYRPTSDAMRSSESQLGGATIFTHVSDSAKNFAGVSFEYNPYNKNGTTIEDMRESTVMVYDNKGNEIYKLEHLPFDAQAPLISQDGKYLGLHFGQIVLDVETKDIGIRIYDIQAKKMIYNVEAKDIAGGYMRNGVMIFRVPTDGDRSTYYVFTPENGILYKKSFEYAQLGLLKRFDKKGAVFVLLPDAERIEEYNKHFDIVAR